MKGAVTGVILLVILIYSVFITQNISGTTSRKTELTMDVSNAVEQTLDSMKETKYESREQMAEAFVQDLKEQMTSDADMQVDIIGIDHVNGLLDVNVRETYHTSDGKKKTIEVRKTAVLEQQQEGT
ncbi:alpha trans-inducing protein [Anaerostipes sp.]|uniref:alpha trans-inducing protein n=1 Tax=Anaerostipes sp. TaxID=1872530 RepID=UPI0025BA0B2E|nr:alpha trans-inducing protein [Anaerostipes sp.]MBS7006967.1 alpha trans-inducing protein [Anaerostipes sp.]